MAFTMADQGRLVNDEDIRTLEKNLAVNLPEDYKVFLKKNNGGVPNPRGFPIHFFENNPKGSIQEFMGIDQQITSSNLDWTYRTFYRRIPNNLFPIARTGTGDLICLSLFGEDQNAVYFWDAQAEHQPPTYDNVYQIAETFQGFLDSIHFYNPLAEEESLPSPTKHDSLH